MTTADMKRRLAALDKEREEAFRAAVAKEPNNPTIPVSCEWMLGLRVTAENFGVPVEELVDLLLQIGMNSFSRAISGGGSNAVSWWLIEMHSKYPDTFNVRAWENRCGVLLSTSFMPSVECPSVNSKNGRQSKTPKSRPPRNDRIIFFSQTVPATRVDAS